MTEDQVAQLSALGRDMQHVTKTLDDIKNELRVLISLRTDHVDLARRVGALEKRVEDQSASSLISIITRVAVMITAVGGALGLIGLIFVKVSQL